MNIKQDLTQGPVVVSDNGGLNEKGILQTVSEVNEEINEKLKILMAEGITYPQIYVPRVDKDNSTELYGIKGIPQIMLFGPDGIIVKRNLRGQKMKAFVADQLKLGPRSYKR